MLDILSNLSYYMRIRINQEMRCTNVKLKNQPLRKTRQTGHTTTPEGLNRQTIPTEFILLPIHKIRQFYKSFYGQKCRQCKRYIFNNIFMSTLIRYA